MRLFLSITLVALLGVAVADVSHLTRTYLPPSRTVAAYTSEVDNLTFGGTGAGAAGGIGAAGAAGFSTDTAFSGKLTAAAPARTYGVPSVASAAFRAPAAAIGNFKSFPVSAQAPAFAPAQGAKYSAPAPAPANAFSSTFSSPAKYSAPSVAAPSRDYLAPIVETFAPLVQKTYGAPLLAPVQAPAPAGVFSGPSAALSAGAKLGTQYAANGGYIY